MKIIAAIFCLLSALCTTVSAFADQPSAFCARQLNSLLKSQEDLARFGKTLDEENRKGTAEGKILALQGVAAYETMSANLNFDVQSFLKSCVK